MKIFILISTVILTSVSTLAKNRTLEIRKWAQSCSQSESCDILIFKEVSKHFRASGKEQALGNYIKSLFQVANNFIWEKNSLEMESDAIGNIIIRLPATGHFKSGNSPSIALQAHMDMVLAYANAKPGENIESYFLNGVEMEEVAGWIQSKDRKTTLGADNGIGVAYALRYLLMPKLSHPPLELVFTTQEEIGLKGASQMQIPLKSRRMICLDGMTNLPNAIITASQGSFGARLSGGQLPSQNSVDFNLLRITLSNLSGGHSGNDIFRERLNSVRGFAQFYDLFKQDYSKIQIVNLIAGDSAVLNKIPNIFSVVLAIPISESKSDSQREAIEKSAKEKVLSVVNLFSDEKDKPFKIEFEFLPKNAEEVQMLAKSQTDSILKSIIEAPNGVIESDPDFPNSVKSSNNLSYVLLSPVTENGETFFKWSAGFFARSYISNSLAAISSKTQDYLLAPIAGYGPTEVKIQSSYGPWVAPKISALQDHIFRQSGLFNRTTKASVGLEPSAFIQRYPDLDVVAIAPNIVEAHTINERIEINSIKNVSTAIEKILSALPQ